MEEGVGEEAFSFSPPGNDGRGVLSAAENGRRTRSTLTSLAGWAAWTSEVSHSG